MGALPKSRIMSIQNEQFGFCWTYSTKRVIWQRRKEFYIVLCTCLKTKAIHLEVVSDLSGQEFVAAVRRRSCSGLYSDCGTTIQQLMKN